MEPQAPAPRVRDMPAPRKTAGVFGPAMRFVFTWPYRAILAGLYRTGVRPWQLTLASLVANVVVGWLLLTGRRFLPGALLIPAGLFDVFDGAVARLRGQDRRVGAFLDSVLDRIGDMILFGCLYSSEAGQGHDLGAALSPFSAFLFLLVFLVPLAIGDYAYEDDACSLQRVFGQPPKLSGLRAICYL